MTSWRKGFWTTGIILLLALAVAGCGSSQPASTAPGSLTKVDFMQAFTPTSEFVYFLAGRDKGFYKEEGIDFVNHEGSGSGNAVKIVGQGDYPIGIADAGQVLLGRSRGVPVTAVLGFYNESPVSLIVLESSGIKSLKDLAGKKLGDAPAAANVIIWKAAMAKAGLDVSKVNFVSMDASAKVPALLQGQVDAILGQQQSADIEAQGKKAVAIRMSESGLDIISDTIIVNDTYLQKNPDVVRRFAKATLKAMEWTKQNPDAAVDFMIKAYPTLQKDVIRKKLDLELPWIFTPSAAKSGLGVMRVEQFDSLHKILFDAKVLETATDVKKAFTNDYLPKK